MQQFFGATSVDPFAVIATQTVAADELSGKAEAERRRAAKGKAQVAAEQQPRLSQISSDSAWSMEHKGRRLGHVAAVVLGAGVPNVSEHIAGLGYSADAAPPSCQPTPSQHSRHSSASHLDVEMAAMRLDSRAGSSSSGASGSSWSGMPGPGCSAAGGSNSSAGGSSWPCAPGGSSSSSAAAAGSGSSSSGDPWARRPL